MILDGFNTEKFRDYLLLLIQKNTQKSNLLKKNGINLATCDPFSALFECATLGIDMAEWCETYESHRQRQKTLQNHIGRLHEVAISCLPDWQESSTTADVENKSLKIIAEVKNKYNTMNSSSALATYKKLEQLVDGVYEGYQSYVVQILAKHNAQSYVSQFTPSDSSKKKAKKSPSRDDIKIIDGESFYTLANDNKQGTMKAVYELMSEILIEEIGEKAKKASLDDTFKSFIDSVLPSNRIPPKLKN